MAHKQDIWEKIRAWLVPKLGVITQFIEDVTGQTYYVESATHRDQFVGRVPMEEEEFEEVLHDLNFIRNPLAAWKHLSTDKDNYEEGSFRKIDYEDHGNKQLHVIVYDSNAIDNSDDGATYVYAHWEYRWDTNPIKHYRGTGANGPEGVKRMKKLLDEYGVNYEPIRP